jgi:hypothetical protein
MNNKHLSLLAISFLSVFLITSCKKTSSSPSSNNNTDTTNNNATNINGTLLTKSIQLDTLHVSGQDTLYKELYKYDSQKRLVSAQQYQYNGTNGSFTGEAYENFYYNGTDTKPYKSTSTPLSGAALDSTVEFYTFDNTGNVSKVKEINYPTSGNDSTIVSFVNSSTIFRIENSYASGTITDRDTTYFQSTLNNGNVLTSAFRNNGILYFYAGITYDSHKNPFAPLVLVANIRRGPISEDGYFGGSFVVSANNVTSYMTTYSDASTTPVTYPYSTSNFVYNTSDYPVSYRYISNDDVDINVKAAGVRYFYYSN